MADADITPVGPGEPGALAGLRVLDLAIFLSAPMVATMLGDLGADVVKAEPPTGDPQRGLGATRDGHPLVWSWLSRNKRSITVDFATEAGLALVAELTAAADVIVLNQTDALLARWRCTPDELLARNPGAVIVRVSGYGSDGPAAGLPANGSMAEAFGGLAHMTGEPDGPPTLSSVPLGDVLAAMSGTIGVLAACWGKAVNGIGGQVVDVAMYEPITALLGTSMVGWLPGRPSPMRTGSRVPNGVPRNVYRTSDDRYVVISGPTDAQVARILPLIGADDEASRARFARSVDRIPNGDELDALVAQWVGEHTAAEVLAAVGAERIPVSEINELADVVAHPQVRHRRSVVTVEDPVCGRVTMPAPAPMLTGTPGHIASLGPALGTGTASVCHDWLGLDDDGVAGLEADGAFGVRP